MNSFSQKILIICGIFCLLIISSSSATENNPSLEQRIAYLEAERTNTDPSPTGIPPSASPSHTAWMMVSTILVLLMTLPGLGLFYGGLVRTKNVLSMLGMCSGIAGLVVLIWYICGYSLIFGTNFSSPFFGGTEYFFLQGVNNTPNTNYACWIPQSIFCMFQLTFAIVTPALIFGATAERLKFKALIFFTCLWMFIVYIPLAHMIWGANGYMNGLSNALAMIPAIDFAGGTVVHMSSGWSALVLALILGPRIGFEKDRMMPHSLVLTFIGTALLWFGWYGFNSGSAFAADTISVSAFVSTTLATGVSCLVWGFIELMSKQKVSVLGMCSGVVSGLVVITPSAGFVSPSQSIIIGCLAGIIPYFFVTFLKHWLKYDDALDTFGIHGIGGTLGAILTGYYANPTINANLFGSAAVKNGMKDIIISNSLILVQLKAVMVTIILSIIGSMIIGFFIKFFIGLRHDNDEESDGLDIHDHGEEGYTMNG